MPPPITARLYVEHRKAEQALKDFNRAIELRPNEVTYLRARAEFFLGVQNDLIVNPDLALRDADKAIASNPHVATSHGLKCRPLYEPGDREAAVAACERALDLKDREGSYLAAARQLPPKSAYPGEATEVDCKVGGGGTRAEVANSLSGPVVPDSVVKIVGAKVKVVAPVSPTRLFVTIRKSAANPGEHLATMGFSGSPLKGCKAYVYPPCSVCTRKISALSHNDLYALGLTWQRDVY